MRTCFHTDCNQQDVLTGNAPEKRLGPLQKKSGNYQFLRANVTLLVFYSLEKWTRSVERHVLNFSWSYTNPEVPHRINGTGLFTYI